MLREDLEVQAARGVDGVPLVEEAVAEAQRHALAQVHLGRMHLLLLEHALHVLAVAQLHVRRDELGPYGHRAPDAVLDKQLDQPDQRIRQLEEIFEEINNKNTGLVACAGGVWAL
jgi:hypothetical protein